MLDAFLEWAQRTETANLIQILVAVLAVPGALWGCYLFYRWMMRRGIDATLDEVKSNVRAMKDKITTPDGTDHSAIKDDLLRFKQQFSACGPRDAFDVLFAGQDLLTKIIGDQQYNDLHELYLMVQKYYAKSMIADQDGQSAEAAQHLKMAESLLDSIKIRVNGIQYHKK